jgi:DNA repair protein RecO (recombination protein O)
MLQKTKGIVLRSVKYGETSLITTVFTEYFGIQAYMIKGVRTTKKASNRAGLLQPATLLELVVHQQPQKTLEHPREFQLSYLYKTIQHEVVKRSCPVFN